MASNPSSPPDGPKQRHHIQVHHMVNALIAADHAIVDELQELIANGNLEKSRLRQMLKDLSEGERRADEIQYIEATHAVNFKPRAAVEMEIGDGDGQPAEAGASLPADPPTEPFPGWKEGWRPAILPAGAHTPENPGSSARPTA